MSKFSIRVLFACVAAGAGLFRVAGISEVFADSDSFTRSYVSTRDSNAASCSGCHMAPLLGGSSKVTVTRAGHMEGARFVEAPGGGLIHVRGGASPSSQPITGLRVSTNLMGAGYVEAIPDDELEQIARAQPGLTHGAVHGQVVRATAIESSHLQKSAGRFGWKSQHSSLRSFAADSLANELGVPNALYPLDLAASPAAGPGVTALTSSEIGQKSHTLDELTAFMRSLEPIDPDTDLAASPEAVHGREIFSRLGCAVCHVPALKTAAVGAPLPDGSGVQSRLGAKTIHPLSDFLVHDIGTGDGIVQQATAQDADQTTANKFRTAPLWGVRYRSWMMHDGKSVTYHQAIERHGGEATKSAELYEALPPAEKHALREFLNSL